MQKIIKEQSKEEQLGHFTESKIKGGKRDLRYDFQENFVVLSILVIKAKSLKDAINNVSTQEFNEIAYLAFSKHTRRIL